MQCIICGEESTELIHPKTNSLFHYCQNCDCYVKDESMFPSNETELDVYSKHQNSLGQKDYVDYLVDFIHKAILPYHQGYKLLEFGSGPTPVLSHILKHRYQFEVKKFDKHFEKDKQYLDHCYDVISCTEVLEHIANPMEVFKEWLTLLKENGIISIMTLFHPSSNEEFFDWWYIRDRTHVIFFSERTFEWIADKFGLEIEFTDHLRIIVFKKRKKD